MVPPGCSLPRRQPWWRIGSWPRWCSARVAASWPCGTASPVRSAIRCRARPPSSRWPPRTGRSTWWPQWPDRPATLVSILTRRDDAATWRGRRGPEPAAVSPVAFWADGPAGPVHSWLYLPEAEQGAADRVHPRRPHVDGHLRLRRRHRVLGLARLCRRRRQLFGLDGVRQGLPRQAPRAMGRARRGRCGGGRACPRARPDTSTRTAWPSPAAARAVSPP